MRRNPHKAVSAKWLCRKAGRWVRDQEVASSNLVTPIFQILTVLQPFVKSRGLILATRGNTTDVSLAEAKATDWLTPEEVAEMCGMTHGRVCQLLRSGEMKGKQGRGRMWAIQRREAEKFREQPTTGRPRNGS